MSDICLAYSDAEGNVFDFPEIEPAFRSGNRFVRVEKADLIKLPYGSYLFTLPQRFPVFFNPKNNDFNHIRLSLEDEEIFAASSFLASGYLRTYLPAYFKEDDARALPLWAYAGLVIIDGEFYVPAIRIDDDIRSDPAIHENDNELKAASAKIKKRFPNNRLIDQLDKCSKKYNCLCARNFFLGRFEVPVPTTPACNAGCIGCLSNQEESTPFVASQNRLGFKPTVNEIKEVIIHHFNNVDSPVASFGQGCEGEPLLRANDISKSIKEVRKETDKGTININTNGSRPDAVKELINSGLDSIRISMNSITKEYYTRYYRPKNYDFNDVKKSIEIALNAGIFVSINLLFLPGFTDMTTEVEALENLLKQFPVNMIQTRNLNIDPDYYFEKIGFKESEPLGIKKLLELLRKKYPDVKLGYYNPPKEKF